MKQEYNKIEYTSNVEYTNYYSSNLNTGTFPLKHQLKKKKKEEKKEEGRKKNEKENKQQVLELPDEFMLSLNFQTPGELILMCLRDARADLSDAGMLQLISSQLRNQQT